LFIALWSLLAVGLFLNPIVSPLVIKYLTSENIYWRLFYILPFPLVIGVALAEVIQRCSRPTNAWAVTGALVLLGSLLVAFSPTSVIRKENGAWLGWPTYKLDPTYAQLSTEIMRYAPEGGMLAPVRLADTLVIMTPRYPQVAIRGDYLVLRIGPYDESTETRNRVAASAYVGGDGGDRQAVAEVLTSNGKPRSVVLAPTMAKDQGTRALLAQYGYTQSVGLSAGWVLAIERAPKERAGAL
jgi:hypothetical protein